VSNLLQVTGLKERQLKDYLEASFAREASTAGAIPRRLLGKPAPLSFGQQEIWLHMQLAPGTLAYNEALTIHRHGPLDIHALERSYNEILRRHEAWRTTFPVIDGQPVQAVEAPEYRSLRVVDLRGTGEESREAEALRIATEQARLPYDLTTGPLVRTLLVRLADDEYRLLLALHHIVFDGFSIYKIFLPELMALYDAFSTGRHSPLPEPRIQYADFASWQSTCFDEKSNAGSYNYWRQKLQGLPALQLPTDCPRPSHQTLRGATYNFTLPPRLSEALKDLSRRQGVTLFMTLFSAFTVLLYRYTGDDDIVVGTVTAGRSRVDTEQIIGFFLNTIALRCDLSGDPKFVELLSRVRKETLETIGQDDIPLGMVRREFQAGGERSCKPLFQVLFSLEPPLCRMRPGWNLTQGEVDTGASKFDLDFQLDERADEIRGHCTYSTDLFDSAYISRMLQHWETLLGAIVADSSLRLARLPIMFPLERERMLTQGNGTCSAGYPRELSIDKMFEKQVRHTPVAIALQAGESKITYEELNERANGIASHLRRSGVGRESVVAVCLERSIEMVVTFLAILKAGGAYLPLNAQYPRERLAFALEESGAQLVLTRSDLLEFLPRDMDKVICLDMLQVDREALWKEGNTSAGSNPLDLAYVMYTSGSSGCPKGVEIPHRAVLRLLFGQTAVRLDGTQVILQLADPCFDASTFEIWGALLHGAKCVLYPGKEVTTRGLYEIIRKHNITTVWLTASLFNTLIDEAPAALSTVSQLLVGGEALSSAHVRKAQRLLPNTQIINGYGPTEGATFACFYPIPNPLGEETVPIGRPLANTVTYVLDRDLQLVPPGVPGELYLGGDGLARGYRAQPELTSERFIPNPFAGGGTRLYKTGDRVRWKRDGNLEFIGRMDEQVKIRGFRVEPTEIESALKAIPGIEAAVVVAKGSTFEKLLVAYVVACSANRLSGDQLRKLLSERIPHYMVPSQFVFLDRLPFNSRGKIDREALAELPLPVPSQPSGLVPRDGLESSLVEIWQGVFNQADVTPLSNFFELGGHSLLALRIIHRMEVTLGQSLSISEFLEAPTIEQIAERLRTRRETAQIR
jgi:amino acid adenylation domain-containing protein